ncbi:cwf21-domain-containing protein, partial [Basidiobolus meristosporus CBS 931.73]
MYNGIGLSTPRGSGTNGFVVRNLSALRDRKEPFSKFDSQRDYKPSTRKPDQGILEHDRKRQIELKCFTLQTELEDEGLPEDEIEKKVSELRESLLLELTNTNERDAKELKVHDTHQLAQAKEIENAKMMQALGINQDTYVEGAAFDEEKRAATKEAMRAKRELESLERSRKEDRGRSHRVERDSSKTRSRNRRR